MTGVRVGPCDWPLAERDCVALDDLDPAARVQVVGAATGLLWRWTGRQFGLCEESVRPYREPDRGSTYRGWAGVPSAGAVGRWWPTLVDGGWVNVSCGRCGDRCGCDSVEEIILPGPVHEVVEVTVDGEVLPADAYRVDGAARLVRVDGGSWPDCQDMEAGPDEDGTWQVTYLRGLEVPDGGQVAAAVLACEMAKGYLDQPCELPQRITDVTREGVSMTVLDTFEGLEGGATGLWLVDSWVASIRHAPRRGRVISPDRRPHRRKTAP